MSRKHPNVIVVFADQWRQQALGCTGDENLAGQTPHFDALAAESVVFDNAVAGFPVCSPYRASLLTGQHAFHHGVFVNDISLQPRGPMLGDLFRQAGYDTAYIGKWHVNGRHRGGFIPPERRGGFDFWEVLECTHDYNNSWYWGNDDAVHRWEGYDAIDQTRHACRYIEDHAGGGADQRPFLLVLSWGPPHNPYGSAPQAYRERFDPQRIHLRPNVPSQLREKARQDLAGYYSHVAALDDCMGQILRTLDASGAAEETVLLLTSDHGDMIGSHGSQRKQQPWDESIRVPLMLRDPRLGSRQCQVRQEPIDAPDLMPTLLGLADLPVPQGLDGLDFSPAIRGQRPVGDGAALLSCIAPFGEWTRAAGGREYRGLRTATHTYVRTLQGPWLLFDNQADPYQLTNLAGHASHAALQAELDALLQKKLDRLGDDFASGPELIRRWRYDRLYTLSENSTVIHTNFIPPQASA